MIFAVSAKTSLFRINIMKNILIPVNKWTTAAGVLGVVLALNSANLFAQTNEPPPTGAILDLGGGETGTAAQAVNHSSTLAPESVSFTAALANTAITFAFREDPAYIFFGNVTLTNTTTGSTTNLISDGDFSGNFSSSWTYANIYGAGAGGEVESCGQFVSGECWVDGAIQAYDAISQTVATTAGDTYLLSFEYTDDGSLSTFSDLSTNGDISNDDGNAIDILAYAQAGLPPAGGNTPEPESFVLLGTGLLGAVRMAWRRRSAK
jgi:PEP-CTERM motif